ncbi:MAG: DUF1844 domain-containing protein [Myxococcota bacterium]
MTHRSEQSERGFTAEDPKTQASDSPPAIDFSTFILSLAASALQHMGEAGIPSGATGFETNLLLARQTIDTLALLEEKTRGNLDEEETELLGSMLYELRMRLVGAERGGS